MHSPFICYILAITSAWILLPPLILITYSHVLSTLDYALITTHIITYFLSNLHWCFHSEHSIYAYMDTYINPGIFTYGSVTCLK